MRNERTRSRTIRKRIGKCRGIFRAFNEIQLSYAEKLDQREDIKAIECNVRLAGLSIGEGYTSDLVCAKEDGSLMVRETVQRKHLLRPSTARLLDASREYIEYYNNERITEKTKGLPPLAYRQQPFVQLGY